MTENYYYFLKTDEIITIKNGISYGTNILNTIFSILLFKIQLKEPPAQQ